MKCDKKHMLLYAVTDRAWTGRQTLLEQIEDALIGGVTMIQLREKAWLNPTSQQRPFRSVTFAAVTGFR